MQHPWDILPQKFLDKLPEIVGDNNTQTVLESFCQRKPSTFRVNTLKITAPELKIKLKEEGIEVEQVDWYPDAFILKNVPQRILSETNWYKEGYVYIQSLSSMIPPLVLDPKPEEKILDMCAAPGSKTTQIATMMHNTGEIMANDKSHTRRYKLDANLKLQGITNTHITPWPGEIIWKKFPEFFDKTLVDVPCSMEGRFFVEDEKSYRDWSPTKVDYLQNMQKFLLRSAISATKPGGTIVYSTCTLSPEENEMVIDWIVKKEKDAIVIEDITIEKLDMTPGKTTWKHKEFTSELSKTKRIIPSNIMEGFYIAKIKKTRSTSFSTY